MVAQFKINDKVILTDSGGGRNLFVDGAVTFNDSDGKTLSLTNTNKTLAFDFFTEYFHRFQGSTSGYVSGGETAGGPGVSNVIQKFSFASDGNSSDVGDLTISMNAASGQSSASHGYNSGGSVFAAPGSYYEGTNVIDKFPFASDGNASDVGDTTQTRQSMGGQSSLTNGYISCGFNWSTSSRVNTIDKFPFSSDANAADVGDGTVNRNATAGQSSTTHGYTSGGYISSVTNVIDKFPFSVDANATDVGDLTQVRWGGAGQSSTENGYTSGGISVTNVIDKFPFSSDANATDVGDLTLQRYGNAGQSSTTHGYTAGGSYPPGTENNVIDKFTFASNANATDVGNLLTGVYTGSGQQV